MKIPFNKPHTVTKPAFDPAAAIALWNAIWGCTRKSLVRQTLDAGLAQLDHRMYRTLWLRFQAHETLTKIGYQVPYADGSKPDGKIDRKENIRNLLNKALRELRNTVPSTRA